MQKLQAVLLNPPIEGALLAAKVEYAKVLRKVLRRFVRWNLADDRTVLFLQGDLNSRTIFDDGVAKDVLQEVLNDTEFLAAINLELPLPLGRWREIVPFESIREMPVTYKLTQTTGSVPMTLGDLLSAREKACDPSAPVRQKSNHTNVLESVGTSQRREWGLTGDPQKVRASHFPAFTDRVLYWAPDSLDRRMTWELPHKGYRVLSEIAGSDHRPVTLEVHLKVEPASRDIGVERHASPISAFSVVSQSIATMISGDSDSECDEQGDLTRRATV